MRSQIGYSQFALLLVRNLIAVIAAFQWESVLPLKQESPNPPVRLGGLEARDFLDEVKLWSVRAFFIHARILSDFIAGFISAERT